MCNKITKQKQKTKTKNDKKTLETQYVGKIDEKYKNDNDYRERNKRIHMQHRNNQKSPIYDIYSSHRMTFKIICHFFFFYFKTCFVSLKNVIKRWQRTAMCNRKRKHGIIAAHGTNV